MGPYDIVAISEAPDDEVASAFALTSPHRATCD